jgi:hypothetical protein
VLATIKVFEKQTVQIQQCHLLKGTDYEKNKIDIKSIDFDNGGYCNTIPEQL